MRFANQLNYFLIICITSWLTSCGGGGGNGDGADNPVEDPVFTPASNWDTLVWDQDDWS